LGASWLKTIGPHLADYATLQLKFLHEGKMAIIQGEQEMLPTVAQLNTNFVVEVYTI